MRLYSCRRALSFCMLHRSLFCTMGTSLCSVHRCDHDGMITTHCATRPTVFQVAVACFLLKLHCRLERLWGLLCAAQSQPRKIRRFVLSVADNNNEQRTRCFRSSGTSFLLQAAAPMGDGSRVLDVLLTWPGGRVAVEVDGPSHFLRDARGALTIPNTPTRLRDHILEQWGYTVVSVRLADWPYGSLCTDEFRDALAARLRAASVPLQASSSASARTWGGRRRLTDAELHLQRPMNSHRACGARG
jgi:RAP domain